MKRWVLLLALLSSTAIADTRQFLLGETALDLRAEARACYLGFIKLYEVDYYAGPDASRCVQLSYLRGFSEEALDEATRKVFEQRHGPDVRARYSADLARIGGAYRAVEPGDRYAYCVAPEAGGLLLREGVAVARLEEPGLAERFLQIWVTSDQPDEGPTWGFGEC